MVKEKKDNNLPEWKPVGIDKKSFYSMTNICDVCGKRRGGTPSLSHRKCAETRKRRGF